MTDDAAEKPVRLAYSWYIVFVLMLAYLLSYVDRSILSLLVGPIRSDLRLSDTEISLLHGFAFAVFYAVLGFPIGRMADSRNRVKIIVAGVGLWSIFTMVCILARNFWHLFFARVGVGIGEAALNPCAYSIITDSFPRRLLARALSTYVMGTYMGFGIAFIVGGLIVGAVTATPTVSIPLIGSVYSWQLAFFYAGLPGLLLMVWIALTIREPERRNLVQPESVGAGVPIADVLRFVRSNRATLSAHLLGFSLIGILVNGLVLWTPTFFHRTYGWDVADAGISYGFILLLCGPAGIFLGGWLADFRDRDSRGGGSFFSAALFVTASIPAAIASPLMASPQVALLLIAWLVFTTSAPWGVAVSALQQMTPNEMRGQISALYLFVVNLVGIGFGPTAIALLTDGLFEDDQAIRYSMALIGGGAACGAALILWWGLPHFRRSTGRNPAHQAVSE